MLFIDGPISTVDQLADYESEIRQVANAEAINLDTKIRLAQTEIGVELLATATQPDSSLTFGFTRNTLTLDQVVVTDALRLWHIFATLGAVYRDAYNRKLNDKYLPKWTEYRELARGAANQIMTMGVAIAFQPLPAPGAPQLTAISGGSLAAGNYFVKTVWVNAQGQESAASPEAGLSLAANQLLQAQPAPPPANATGWIAYASNVSSGEQKQFYVPLNPFYQWTLPTTGLIAGPVPGDGQPYDVLRTVPRTLQRG
jgi:hypothetical protein